jgi:hypothetical protein
MDPRRARHAGPAAQGEAPIIATPGTGMSSTPRLRQHADSFCVQEGITAVSRSAFGKEVRAVFPHVGASVRLPGPEPRPRGYRGIRYIEPTRVATVSKHFLTPVADISFGPAESEETEQSHLDSSASSVGGETGSIG